MTPTTLLIGVFFLCGLKGSVLSQHGHCSGNQCLALSLEPQDFKGARRICGETKGQLVEFSLGHAEKLFKDSFTGKFWMEQSPGEAALGSLMCPAISVSRERNLTVVLQPCSSRLDGFICQYAYDAVCNGVQAGEGAQVVYTTNNVEFDLEESETFPPGTIAEVVKVGAEYPESIHVCVTPGWMQAPWFCEVMRGGCEHDCSSSTCTCPAGKILHPNNVSCSDGACASNPCTGVGEECQANQEGFSCTCKRGFIREGGVCVNVSICSDCEHLKCEKVNGEYKCVCKKGFIVSPVDPTKCDLDCTERDCPARCIWVGNKHQCFCLDGYVEDVKDTNISNPFCTDIDECVASQCDHTCKNTFGSFICSCNEGFKLDDDMLSCLRIEEDDDEGSGYTTPYPTPDGPHQAAAVPSYIKTGSVLGITVFMLMCAALLFFLIRNACKRCGKFELSQLKHPDIDIFYLQQVSSETYKRLSFDKQIKNDPQIL